MWKDEYYDDGSCLCRDLYTENGMEDACYEIVFDRDGTRYYCFVYASCIDTALGAFFRAHDDVAYKEIIDHMEV